MNPFDVIGLIFNEAFFRPVINLLALILHGLNLLHIPGSLGLSILILTVIIRLLVWPFMASQIKSAKKLGELKPHLDALKSKHKDNKQALAAAQMELYKQHGVNPAGGCLPAIIQIPVFIALYQAINHFVPGSGNGIEAINNLIYFPWLKLTTAPDPYFIGVNLGVHPSSFMESGMFLLLIPVVTAGLTFLQSKMAVPKPVKVYKTDSPKEIKEKVTTDDAMSTVQSQMVYMMPLMFGYFAFTLPTGLAIYYNAYTILGIIQQYRVAGWGGLQDIIDRLKK
ncbi:MAG: YidC/Oxa1 family membrane protein insertase [Candidatus Daviesbacteria bacterium]|nr:YidC/Oxa1 family membrane protein insertase [Candidatus Daviesbacteria bacterium]